MGKRAIRLWARRLRRIATNIAKLPQLMKGEEYSIVDRPNSWGFSWVLSALWGKAYRGTFAYALPSNSPTTKGGTTCETFQFTCSLWPVLWGYHLPWPSLMKAIMPNVARRP